MRIGFVSAMIIIAGMLGGCSIFGEEAAPEPEFNVVIAEPPFELRDYPALVLAKTSMSDGSSPAFRRLFDYISGENGGKRKIAMTAPVIRNNAGTEIAMAAPVIRARRKLADIDKDMAFILTPEFSVDSAPKPTNPAIHIVEMPARRVAVIKFSGLASDDDIAAETESLHRWIDAAGLEETGPPEMAQYNPPWTIPSLRRNEVLMPIRY